MKHFSQKKISKLNLIIGAIIIAAISLLYTKFLVDELKMEEEKKIELWAEATRQLVKPDNNQTSIGLALEVLKNNTTVPVILVDDNNNIHHYRNISLPKKNANKELKRQFEKLRKYGKKIEINLGKEDKQYLYYKTSTLLTKLTWFPILQLGVVGIFVFIAYQAFSSTRKAEQNQVWVGMAKETAHQLGTPISSLLGWVNLLALKSNETSTIKEIESDINRLQNIADRFSKIGSKPILKPTKLFDLAQQSIQYLKPRSSDKVSFKLDIDKDIKLIANDTLLEWVFENLIKNAIDAIKGEGNITISSTKIGTKVALDFSDNGKGITKTNFKRVFDPGYTTKERGWGLGLSLTKRIIESYHRGKIFVKESEPGMKTTFRIILDQT
jgi:signal transduction histidine kinase